MTLIQSIRNIIDNGNKNTEIIVPIDKRSITVDNSNGANVSTDVFPLLTGLRNNLVLGQAGTTIITGATSNINISKFTGNTARWKNETENSAEENNITFDGITLKPYRLTSYITVSNEWLLQDSNGANETLKQDLLNSICECLEETILGNEEGIYKPEGLFYGIDEITPISYNEIVSMEEELDNNNVPNFNRTFIISNSAKSILRKTKKESGGKGRYVLEKQKIQSIPTLSTNSVIENGILFGDFSELIIAVFGPVLISIDPFSLAIEGKTKITINFFVDAKPRRKECFVKRIIEEGNDEPKEPEVVLTGHLRGKFTDDSTSADWWCYKKGYLRVNITENVDPITKEFEVDLENPTTLGELFNYNSKLEKIYEVPFDENITYMQNMFRGCSALSEIKGIENWQTKNVTNIQSMFDSCKALQTLDISDWNVEKVEAMSSMFSGCSELQSINLSNWNVKNVTSIFEIFRNCYALQTLNLGNWNVENVTSLDRIFSLCYALETINGRIYNIKVNLDMSSCSKLSKESVLVLLNGLADVGETRTITFSSKITLTESEAAIATAKGWTISGAKIVAD